VLVTAEDFRKLPQLVLPAASGGAGISVWSPSFCECIQRLLSLLSESVEPSDEADRTAVEPAALGPSAAVHHIASADALALESCAQAAIQSINDGPAGAAATDGGVMKQRSHALLELVSELRRVMGTGWLLEFGSPIEAELAKVDRAAFIFYFQNHDEVGNFRLAQRLFGRMHEPIAQRLVAAATVLLLVGCPQTPLLFMGQEFGARSPFHFFTDHNPGLGSAVERGRTNEMEASWGADAVEQMLSPQDPRAFEESVLDWTELETPQGKAAFELHRDCLRLRRTYLQSRADGSFRCFQLDQAAVLVCEHHASFGADAVPFAVVTNFGLDPVDMALKTLGAREWQVLLSTWDRATVGSDPGAPKPSQELLVLPACSAVVLLGTATPK
jgi:hypothetical protein